MLMMMMALIAKPINWNFIDFIYFLSPYPSPLCVLSTFLFVSFYVMWRMTLFDLCWIYVLSSLAPSGISRTQAAINSLWIELKNDLPLRNSLDIFIFNQRTRSTGQWITSRCKPSLWRNTSLHQLQSLETMHGVMFSSWCSSCDSSRESLSLSKKQCTYRPKFTVPN